MRFLLIFRHGEVYAIRPSSGHHACVSAHLTANATIEQGRFSSGSIIADASVNKGHIYGIILIIRAFVPADLY